MYTLGHKPHTHHNLYAFAALGIAGFIMLGAWLANKYLQPDTILSDSHGVVRHVDVVKPPTKLASNSIFTIMIPRSWSVTDSQYIPAAQYAWHGTRAEDSARRIDVYVDSIPKDMAVNKLLPLHGSGDQVIITGNVSDNCVNFTDASKADKLTAKVLAKWSGVSFYCDTGNYARNVIGTGAPGSINRVAATGKIAGQHAFFFVYTDHSAEPDYSIFTDMLNSFRVK